MDQAPISLAPPADLHPVIRTYRNQDSLSKQLFFDFIAEFLGAEIVGLQSGFGYGPDMILVRGCQGSTLSVACDTMLMPVEQARAVVAAKLLQSHRAFSFAPISIEEAREAGIAW